VAKNIKWVVLLFFLKASAINAFVLDNENIHIEEVLPLFNVHEKNIFVTQSDKKINPRPIVVPDRVRLGKVNGMLNSSGFIGETLFKDLIIKTDNDELDIEIKVHDISQTGIKITPRVVTNWYQAGKTTRQKKFSGELTYELLLSDDRNLVINDKWIKSDKGGWVYVPPEIKQSDILNTVLRPKQYKRILLKIVLGPGVDPGVYSASLEISLHKSSKKVSLNVPIKIDVKPVKLLEELQDKYKLLLYTAFKLNDQVERQGAYVNTMRLHGDENQRKKLLLAYFNDIKDHGFNGITIRDWDQVYLEETLKITQKIGFKYVVLHATTPVSRKYKGMINPSIRDNVRELYEKYNSELFYYGYDEVGGNKLLDNQLNLNKSSHRVGGKMINAVFWSDHPNAINAIGNEERKCFDVIAFSMGSHGQDKMFKSLPNKEREDFCSKKGTEYLTYWHPHVENPVLNRIFTGFWLWASGFNGVIPHGYYFPSHIERVLSKEDLERGVSNASSPYDDWAFWLPGSPLRHHNSVYPSSSGPIGTLQWEGVLNGHMDLKYILTLEARLNEDGIESGQKNKIKALLGQIRNEVLQLDSAYMSDSESIYYLKKLEGWKKEISILLLN